MKKLMALILSISLPISSFAECVKPVTLLDEGTSAPCRGFLFTPQKELEVRILSKEFDLLELENKNLNEIVDKQRKKEANYLNIMDLEQKKTELWKVRAEDITMKYTTVQDNRTKRDVVFMLAGIGLTVLSAYAIGQAAKASK